VSCHERTREVLRRPRHPCGEEGDASASTSERFAIGCDRRLLVGLESRRRIGLRLVAQGLRRPSDSKVAGIGEDARCRSLRRPGQGTRPAGLGRSNVPAVRKTPEALSVAPAGVLVGGRRVIRTRLPPRSGWTTVRDTRWDRKPRLSCDHPATGDAWRREGGQRALLRAERTPLCPTRRSALMEAKPETDAFHEGGSEGGGSSDHHLKSWCLQAIRQ
jgi:hypothetical protein